MSFSRLQTIQKVNLLNDTHPSPFLKPEVRFRFQRANLYRPGAPSPTLARARPRASVIVCLLSSDCPDHQLGQSSIGDRLALYARDSDSLGNIGNTGAIPQ
jgi:hypothetical protein